MQEQKSKKPINFGKHISRKHRGVVRSLGYNLTLLDEQAMRHLATVAYLRLSPGERAFTAIAFIMGLDDDEYQAVIEFVEGGDV